MASPGTLLTAVEQRSWRTGDLGRFENVGWTADRFSFVTSMLVQASIVLVGFDKTITSGISVGLVAAVALCPLWLPVLRKHTLAPLLLVLTLLCIPAGYILGRISSVDHVVNTSLRNTWFALLLSGMAGFVLILWARQLFPAYRIVLLFGIGSLAQALLYSNMSWKFDLSIPTTFVVLGILERYRSRVVPAVAVFVLGVFGVIDEGRSFFGFCVLAAALTLWQLRPARGEHTSRWFPVILMAGICAGIYMLGASLLTSGYLGTELQERSNMQIESSGSLLAGGRPEWAATRELVKMNPSGFGAGVVPGWEDLQAGRAGLASINIDAGGYTTNYLFGEGFELHSVASDLWVSFGLVGFALAVVILIALVRSMSFLIAERRATTSVLFACSLALWYLLFGPIYTNWLDICVALGLSLVVRDSHRNVAVDARGDGTAPEVDRP